MTDQSVKKSRGSRHDESRFWKVASDPSDLFTGNLFRLVDLEAGGFDPGTVFEHIRTGERRVAGVDGTTRKRESNGKLSFRSHRTGPALFQAKAASGGLHAL